MPDVSTELCIRTLAGIVSQETVPPAARVSILAVQYFMRPLRCI